MLNCARYSLTISRFARNSTVGSQSRSSVGSCSSITFLNHMLLGLDAQMVFDEDSFFGETIRSDWIQVNVIDVERAFVGGL